MKEKESQANLFLRISYKLFSSSVCIFISTFFSVIYIYKQNITFSSQFVQHIDVETAGSLYLIENDKIIPSD